MAQAARAFVAVTDRLIGLLALVAALLAAGLMLATAADVFMRYLFRSPIRGVFELTEVAMGLIVFFALPLMVRNRGNIVVTILFDRFPAGVRRLATFLTELLGAAICGVIAWRMWLYGERILRFGEVTLELRIPRGLVAQSMAALLVVTAVAFVICAIEALARDEPQDARGPGA